MWYTVVGIIDSTPLLSLFMEEREMIKKFIAGLMAASLVFSLCACGQETESKKSNETKVNSIDSEGKVTAEETTIHIHIPTVATCVEDSYCEDCYESLSPALGHDYQDGSCTRCNDIDPDSLPVNLNDVFLIDGKKYAFSTSAMTDSFGNVHTNTHEFRPSSSTASHAIFNINGEYKEFKGRVVMPSDAAYEAEVLITIYVDNVKKYEKARFNKITDDVTFSIDVTGAKMLKIQMSSNTIFDDDCYIVDAQLFKQ